MFLWKNNKIGKPLPRDYQGRERGIRGRRKVRKGVGRRKGKAGGGGKMKGGEKENGGEEMKGRGEGEERNGREVEGG